MSELATHVGIDAHKVELQVAMLAPDATTPVTWTVRNEARALERAAPGSVSCCYEAGPCGYALQRQLEGPGPVPGDRAGAGALASRDSHHVSGAELQGCPAGASAGEGGGAAVVRERPADSTSLTAAVSRWSAARLKMPSGIDRAAAVADDGADRGGAECRAEGRRAPSAIPRSRGLRRCPPRGHASGAGPCSRRRRRRCGSAAPTTVNAAAPSGATCGSADRTGPTHRRAASAARPPAPTSTSSSAARGRTRSRHDAPSARRTASSWACSAPRVSSIRTSCRRRPGGRRP